MQTNSETAPDSVSHGAFPLCFRRKFRRPYCAGGCLTYPPAAASGALLREPVKRSPCRSHPVFHGWIKDRLTPKRFRDAGHFWGIAPGTTPGAIRARMADVDNMLRQAGI